MRPIKFVIVLSLIFLTLFSSCNNSPTFHGVSPSTTIPINVSDSISTDTLPPRYSLYQSDRKVYIIDHLSNKPKVVYISDKEGVDGDAAFYTSLLLILLFLLLMAMFLYL